MAVSSLLSCCRAMTFKTLQLESWGLRGLPPSLSLCTKSGGSKKGPPKNVVPPQKRIKLLATKAAVEFPQKLSSPSHPQPANKGETVARTNPDEALKLSKEDLRKFLSRKALIEVLQKRIHKKKAIIASAGGLNKKMTDRESSSSSSSDSDSSSESDEEDIASEIAVKTKVEFPSREPFFFEKRAVKTTVLPEQSFPQKKDQEQMPKKKPYKPKTEESPIEQKGPYKIVAAENETFVADAVISDLKPTPKETHLQSMVSKTWSEESHRQAEVGVEKSRYLKEPVMEPATRQLSKTPSVSRQGVEQKLTLLKKQETKTREIQGTETQGATFKLQEEALKDEAPVIDTTTTKEDMQEAGTLKDEAPVIDTTTTKEDMQEAGAQTEEQGIIQETQTAASPAQEEFDNSS
uniref:NADH:ubiquinone oxidoreductase subunit V3 n=1 Tax=Sphenodon punctatus TaxID=8508 RepID=A0A8D0HPY1_SPHPU